MLQQIVDLKAEADALFVLLRDLPETAWGKPTQFKGWTVDDVVIHLHAGDLLAATSVKSPDAFKAMLADIRTRRAGGLSSIEENRQRIGPLAGNALLQRWRTQLDELCTLLAARDPDARLAWAGPDMGVRMFTTARQMEVWAHGQEIYDVLGKDRAPTDRLRSIALIGVRTYGWIEIAIGGGQAPRIAADTIGDEELALCVLRAASRWELGGDGDGDNRVPIVFRPRTP